VTCCALCGTFYCSPTTSFSLLWRGVSLLYETRRILGRVLNSRAVHQGQPRMKRGLCLALVDALEQLSAADWNILIFHHKCEIIESTGGTQEAISSWSSLPKQTRWRETKFHMKPKMRIRPQCRVTTPLWAPGAVSGQRKKKRNWGAKFGPGND
jgi:hypothetical protein